MYYVCFILILLKNNEIEPYSIWSFEFTYDALFWISLMDQVLLINDIKKVSLKDLQYTISCLSKAPDKQSTLVVHSV